MAIILETDRVGHLIGIDRLENRDPCLSVTDCSGYNKMHGSGGQQVLAWEFETKPKLKRFLETKNFVLITSILILWEVFLICVSSLVLKDSYR